MQNSNSDSSKPPRSSTVHGGEDVTPLKDSEAPVLKVDSWIDTEVNIRQGIHLLDFWNYSCPGCRKTVSKLDELHSGVDSLNVVGIHVPEFDFEEERSNVEKAVDKLGLSYSVALDRGATHRDYGNRHGSQRVLVHDGKVVWTQAGHSDFEGLAGKIKELSEEEEVPEMEETRPEMVYLGFRKGSGTNEEGVFRGKRRFPVQGDRKKGEVYLEGEWTMEEDYLEAGKNARLFFKFEHPELSAVIDPDGSMKDIDVLVDGDFVDEKKAGEDLRSEDRSYVRVNHPDLYSLVSSEGATEVVLDSEEGVRIHALSLE